MAFNYGKYIFCSKIPPTIWQVKIVCSTHHMCLTHGHVQNIDETIIKHLVLKTRVQCLLHLKCLKNPKIIPGAPSLMCKVNF